MKLIDNAAAMPRMFSTWVAAVAIAFGSLPPELQTAVLGAWLPAERVPAALGVLFLLARVVKQPALTPKEDPPPP